MNKKTIFVISLFIIVAAFIVYWVFRESMFSKEILRLEILGPDKATAGAEIEYNIKYKNNGNFVLQNPKLIFDTPNNSLTEDGKTRISQDLKDIYPGGEEVVKIKTRLLGKEGDFKTAKASLSYTPKNLTVRYESNTTFTTKIDQVPITLNFDLPTKVEKGKDLQYSINYFSNVDYPLENLSLKIDPTSGFDFGSSDPSSLDHSEWRLPTLNQAQGGRVSVTGKISADTNQDLTFSASLGMWQNGSFVVIKQASTSVQVIQPLLSISQQINGSSSYVASPGETLHYQIFFKNIGSSPFDNLSATVKLDNSALDMSTVQPGEGQFQSNNNMIAWDYNQSSQLKYLGAQQQGELDFFAKVKNSWTPSGTDANNTVIADEVNISQITQKFTIKVNSGLVISQAGFYKGSSIENSGLTPPKSGQATTYTITWDIKNYFNDAKNVKVKATLPQNVILTGKIMPNDESSNFSFDSASHEIVWSAGDILTGTGVNGDPVSLSFQVSLTPSDSQKGSVASIIGQVQISGENQFTNTTIASSASGIDTSLPDDFVNSGGGVVQ